MKHTTVACVCLLSLAILGVYELKSRFVMVNPIPADSFEYKFELLNGQVPVNPYGISK